MFLLAAIIILSYLVGSIPTSIIVSKAVKGIDIREHGSGNAGGTNVMRVLGWKHGVFVIFLDVLKGVIAVIVIARLHYGNIPFENATPFDDFTLVQIIAGIAAVIGHVWTVFAGFKGGKGIATALGMLLMIVTVDMLIAVGVFIVVVFISKYVSLGSILGAVAVPLALIIRENIFNVDIQGYNTLLPFVVFVSLFVIFNHRKNIVRILNGSENKLSFSKKS
ncbi:MAG: glycerol-3-phosphate 1-O-acyltransferase PlsY [Ignavibacteriales bacterium]|nr:glycerol-3-phosphate 1-O-acyltransferase PlsY [Ignavibacteriales bacterium]MBK7379608.1 glycerol-3-phosphate 1-O-acyltransferase PlsY [Ignavibacteriales bacterium]